MVAWANCGSELSPKTTGCNPPLVSSPRERLLERGQLRGRREHPHDRRARGDHAPAARRGPKRVEHALMVARRRCARRFRRGRLHPRVRSASPVGPAVLAECSRCNHGPPKSFIVRSLSWQRSAGCCLSFRADAVAGDVICSVLRQRFLGLDISTHVVDKGNKHLRKLYLLCLQSRSAGTATCCL